MVINNINLKKKEFIDYTNLIFDNVVVINTEKMYELSKDKNICF